MLEQKPTGAFIGLDVTEFPMAGYPVRVYNRTSQGLSLDKAIMKSMLIQHLQLLFNQRSRQWDITVLDYNLLTDLGQNHFDKLTP